MPAKPFNWKLFFVLLVAAIFGVIAVLPYTLELQGDLLSSLELPVPLWLLLILQLGQNAVLFALAVGIGLWAANKTGLGAPLLEAKLAGESIGKRLKAILLPSILIGMLAAAAIVALDVLLFNPLLVAELGDKASALAGSAIKPAAWKGLLASFYGGISEEILLRLFLMTLFVWLGKFVSKTADGRPTLTVLWTANILAAVLFGLGHLPATAMILPLTSLVILRAIVLNGLAGLAFGYLYFSRGLEAAMLAHFSADIVLHVLLAL